MEGELSVQIPLDDVDPLRVARLAAQLLRPKDKTKHLSAFKYDRGKRLQSRFKTWGGADLELFLILLPLHFGPGEVEPSSATQGRRDPLLAALLHLPVADR